MADLNRCRIIPVDDIPLKSAATEQRTLFSNRVSVFTSGGDKVATLTPKHERHLTVALEKEF